MRPRPSAGFLMSRTSIALWKAGVIGSSLIFQTWVPVRAPARYKYSLFWSILMFQGELSWTKVGVPAMFTVLSKENIFDYRVLKIFGKSVLKFGTSFSYIFKVYPLPNS